MVRNIWANLLTGLLLAGLFVFTSLTFPLQYFPMYSIDTVQVNILLGVRDFYQLKHLCMQP